MGDWGPHGQGGCCEVRPGLGACLPFPPPPPHPVTFLGLGLDLCRESVCPAIGSTVAPGDTRSSVASLSPFRAPPAVSPSRPPTPDLLLPLFAVWGRCLNACRSLQSPGPPGFSRHLAPALTQHPPALPWTACVLGLAVPVPPTLGYLLSSPGFCRGCSPAPGSRGSWAPDPGISLPSHRGSSSEPVSTVCSHRVLASALLY